MTEKVETIGSKHGDGSYVRRRLRTISSCSSCTSEDDEEDGERPHISLYQYFMSELTRGYFLENDKAKYAEKRKRVYTFMQIPREMESFIMFGLFQCTDAFLFIFTFLPLRFILALLQVFTHPCGFIKAGSRRILDHAQICDVLKSIVMIMCCLMMHYVDTSMLYHIIRGQAIIKLYIFFNMLEIADKLFASFGQDILDSLFWTAAEPRDRKREHIGVIPHLILAIFYVFLHAILVLFQAICLNVAFNSHNKALLTIMMSNNFVEIKGSVFKKFAKNNLFQMSCSDVRERFHYLILLFIVLIRNMTEFSWNIDHLWQLVPDIVMVLISEVLVDWLKHAFIVKFNDISSDVYKEYTISLAYDTAISRQKDAFSDHSDLVSRRMGFTPLPLGCLLFKIVCQSLKVHGYLGIFLCFLGYLCLVFLKILNSILLLGLASDHINEYRKSREEMSEKEKEQEKSRTSSDLIQIRRFSIATDTFPTRKKKRTHKRSSSDVKIPTTTKEDAPPIPLSPSLSPNLCIRQDSILSKPILFSDSSVNISGMGINNEFTEFKQEMDKKEEKREEDKKEKKAENAETRSHGDVNSSFTEDKPPLSDIDRYSMCSNRIV
ncbi:transmembrane anterior posterior transformation protein 1 homolog [Lineus longissimus]|uniref:transmembrane anterior posterior transformation protein 1 homolog n=1 Tax=Lineus longissimus TaxID=88925 RepID=UPI002B4CADD5